MRTSVLVAVLGLAAACGGSSHDASVGAGSATAAPPRSSAADAKPAPTPAPAPATPAADGSDDDDAADDAPSGPTISLGELTFIGQLDRDAIHKGVKRQLNKIIYCYDGALKDQPKLAGTIIAQFLIGPDGTVSVVSATGMDPAVASCIAGVLKAITFPKPKDGRSVQVSYPFSFAPTGG